MRLEWVSSAWAEAARSDLQRQLSAVLPGDTKAQAEFLESALVALDAHRKLVVPYIEERKRRNSKLRTFAKAARQFESAIRKIGEDTRDLIEQVEYVRSGNREFSSFGRTVEAGARALLTAEICDRLSLEGRRIGCPRSNAGFLISDLAAAWVGSFKERPSAAAEGLFVRALNVLLDEAGLPSMGETQVEGLLAGTATAAPAPRRGRKPHRRNPAKPMRRF